MSQEPFVDDRAGLVTPSPLIDDASHQPRGPSVDFNDPAPPISDTVAGAARAVGCEAKSFMSEANSGSHIVGEPATTQSVPPLSGAHAPRWADYGVYEVPVPFGLQLNNLEGGGVFIHYGRRVPVAGVNALRSLWAKSPAYLLVAPDTHPAYPPDAVTVGSQQRWVRCPSFSPAQIGAVEAFVLEYRGRGPLPLPAVNFSKFIDPGLPAPVLFDPAAVRR